MFVRQGSVIQVLSQGSSASASGTGLNAMSFSSSLGLRIQRSRFGSFRGGEKEVVRQCFLFTNHMLLCNRDPNGKLNMIEVRRTIVWTILRYFSCFSTEFSRYTGHRTNSPIRSHPYRGHQRPSVSVQPGPLSFRYLSNYIALQMVDTGPIRSLVWAS